LLFTLIILPILSHIIPVATLRRPGSEEPKQENIQMSHTVSPFLHGVFLKMNKTKFILKNLVNITKSKQTQIHSMFM
jgi:hypothetical protein